MINRDIRVLKGGCSIIIEGPDNCGKTTQIELLKNLFINNGIMTHMLHYSSIKTTYHNVKELSKELYFDAFSMICSNQTAERNLLFDRLHGGEWVYGKIYRHYEAEYIYQLEKSWLDERVFNQDNIYLIVMIDDAVKLLNREDGKSMSESIDDVAKKIETKKFEVERFVDFYNRSQISNKLLMNIENKTIHDVHEEIKTFLQDRRI